ncbi:MAG: hypothetical protein Q9194_002684 [Teloschistes cf. exilis]
MSGTNELDQQSDNGTTDTQKVQEWLPSVQKASCQGISECDETTPRCVNCTTADVQCQYLSHKAKQPNPAEVVSVVSGADETVPPSGLAVSTPKSDDRDTYRSSNASPGLESDRMGLCFDIHDMELLHHWSTATYATLTPELDQQEMWQTTVIRVGMNHHFLLFEILGIAALHLAVSRPDQKKLYYARATELQNNALTGFNNEVIQVDESNCTAILLYSSLLGVHILANRSETADLGLSEYLDHLLRYIEMTRGVRNLVIADWWRFLQASEIQPLTRLSVNDAKPPYNIPLECQQLGDLIQESDLSHSSIQAYNQAIDRLFWVYDVADVPASTHDNIRWVISWPVQLSAEYMMLLNQRRPEALIILAYYGVVLHSYRKSWAIGDCGAHLVNAVNAQLLMSRDVSAKGNLAAKGDLTVNGVVIGHLVPAKMLNL